MDAKKASKVHKSRYYFDTKIGRSTYLVFLGLCCYTGVWAYFTLKYIDLKKFSVKNTRLWAFLDSEQFRNRSAALYGLAQPSREDLERYRKELELVTGRW